MRLVIPYVGSLTEADARLVRIAEFLGCRCELLGFERGVRLSPELLESRISDRNCCFVVNPAAMSAWITNGLFPDEFARCLATQFSFVLVHNLFSDGFTDSALRALSGGALQSVRPVGGAGLNYEVAAHNDFCGAFSGLQFGPVNVANDQVIAMQNRARDVRTHIAIGGDAFLAAVQRERAQIFVLGSANLADLNAKTTAGAVAEYFSQLIPVAMVLRFMFGDECWQPSEHHATLIIDDPLLRENYGFLNYERLLALMEQYNFHTTIAFIPHNYLRNSKRVTELFRQRPERFSICFHGNDHTGAEFATKDGGLLNSMLAQAEERMKVYEEQTGIPCNRVMIFPQGFFSREAMAVLKAHNFTAAVNTGSSAYGEHLDLTLAEITDVAISRYAGFPLFLRQYVRHIKAEDLAFNLFFGKPILIVEHHDLFKHAECLIELVRSIHNIAPNIQWSDLQTAVEGSYMTRWGSDRVLEVRGYSQALRIANSHHNGVECAITWQFESIRSEAPKAFIDGLAPLDPRTDEKGIHVFFDLAPGSSRRLSLLYRNDFPLSDVLRTFQWKAKAFLRRRLSEIRDDHLMKRPHLFSIARALQRRFYKGASAHLPLSQGG